MFCGENSLIHWLVASNKPRCASQWMMDALDVDNVSHPSRPSFCTDLWWVNREMFLQPFSILFAVEVNPIEVDGRLDGVEEVTLVNVW